MENKIIKIGNKTVILSWEEDNSFEVDNILRIDYSNLLGEILTFPLILNRLGIILSDIEYYLRLKTFDVDKAYSNVQKELAKAYDRAYKSLKMEGIPSPTGPQIEKKSKEDSEVLKLEEIHWNLKKELIEIQHDRDDINSLYWSAKSKDDKLNKITDKLSPKEFENEIIEGKINNVMIKISKGIGIN